MEVRGKWGFEVNLEQSEISEHETIKRDKAATPKKIWKHRNNKEPEFGESENLIFNSEILL